MGYFPLYMNVTGQNCVVVGGGNIAARKIEKLLPFQANITVIAPSVCKEIAENKAITIRKRTFQDSDADGAFLVIGATNDTQINSHIAEICRKKHIPVNIVDAPQLCSFYFPGIVRKEPVTVAISTDGAAPLLARYLRESIEEIIDDTVIKTAETLQTGRKKLRSMAAGETVRKAILEDLLARCLHGDAPENIDTYLYEMRELHDHSDWNTEKQTCACTDGNGLSGTETSLSGAANRDRSHHNKGR